MAVNTKSPALRKEMTFSAKINSTGFQQTINNTLKDPKRSANFTAAIITAVSTNQSLANCDSGTILSGALLAESLNLQHSPQMGQYYLVPFNDKKSGTTKATFILGYKGLIQLALRTGEYKKLTVVDVRECENPRWDRFNEELTYNNNVDPDELEHSPVVGYYAMFEYTNGFRKALYWTKEKMLDHADTYSAAFSKSAYEKIQAGKVSDKDMWKYSSYWYKDFDGMAAKTLLRQLISKWGIMSTEFVKAIDSDGGIATARNGGVDVEPESELVSVDEHDVPKSNPKTGEVIIDAEAAASVEPEEGDIDDL